MEALEIIADLVILMPGPVMLLYCALHPSGLKKFYVYGEPLRSPELVDRNPDDMTRADAPTVSNRPHATREELVAKWKDLRQSEMDAVRLRIDIRALEADLGEGDPYRDHGHATLPASDARKTG